MKIIKSIISKLLTFVMVITNVLLCFTNTAYASTIRLNYNTEKSEDDLDLEVSFNDTTVVDDTRINVKADRGVFPKNSYMEAVATQSELSRLSDNEETTAAVTKAFDITIYDEDGNEIEPDTSKGQVTVTFEDDLIENQNIESTVYHINDDNEAEELTIVDNEDSSVTVETDGFSVYVVEFTYNKKEFVLNGNSETKLDDILTAVGLSGTIDEAFSSNEELFSVNLRDGEWYVKAIKHFTTEETLTVTLDGVDYQIQVTDEQGEIIINNLDAVLKSGATKQNGQYIWNASYTSSGHTFVYRLNYSTSGEFEIPVPNFTYKANGTVSSAEGGFQIRVPKSILKDKFGNQADTYEMSVPLLSKNSAVENTNKYAYFVDGNDLVIVNVQELPAATVGMFDISYTTSTATYNYFDMKMSDDFYGVASVSGKIKESNKIPVSINTEAEISYVSKKTPVLYQSWQSNWGNKPADADNYYYLVWEIYTSIKGTPTQRYDFKLEDTLQTTDHAELVGYKLGRNSYSDVNTESNCINNSRYDYVLTKHDKAYYDAKTYYEIKNKIVATITPVDKVDPETKASDTAKFSYSKPVFQEPPGNISVRKYGNENWYDKFYYSWPYAAYNLQELQKESTQGQKSINDIKYYAELEAYTYPWTLENGTNPLDPNSYGKKAVNMEFKDDILYLLDPAKDRFSNENYYKDQKDIDEVSPLNPEDYDFSYVTYDAIMSDAKYDDFTKKFTTTDNAHEYNENDILNISIKTNDTWKENIGSINLYTKETVIDNKYIIRLTDKKITFGKDVDGFKITCSNAHYHTFIKMYPYVNLYNTANVQSIIGTGDNALEWVILKNVDSVKATTSEGNLILDEARIIGDRLRRSEKNSYIYKSVTSAKNDTANERYLLGWSVNAYESIKQGNNDSSEKIPQESGTFYDLIPEGATVQRSSVTVYDENSRLSSNFYDVDIIKDWRNSGQDMLVIKIYQRGTNYKVYYTTIHPWTTVMDRGTDVYNPVAYETGNSEIAKGFKDNGGKLPESVKSYFTNLDPEYDAILSKIPADTEGCFIYDDAKCDINALLSATTGLDKKVRTTETENWSYEAFVHNNDTYEYQLRYANSDNTSTKGLILYDSLENYYLTEGAKQGKSEWYGKFLRVDTSQMKEMGASPVVYYSTVKDLDLDVQPDLSDSKWSTVLPDDASKVTAIAIDISKGINGDDFILKKGESVSATIFMQAPLLIDGNHSNYPRTFNNVFANGIIVDKNNDESDFYIHQDYTAVKFRIVGDVYFKKINVKNVDENVPNIEFRLYGTSDYGINIDELRLSGADGIVNFNDIECGTYSLEETNSGTEWVCDHTIHKVVIDKNRNVYIDDTLTTKSEPVIFKNTPRIHKDIVFWKEKYGTHIGLNGTEFKLNGTSDYGTNVTQYKKSLNGKVTFEDIEKGTYTLTEIKASNNFYIQNQIVGTFTIDDDGIISFKANTLIDSETDNAGSIIVYNIPYYEFQLSKRSDYDNGPIQGAKFRLSGTSDYGTTVNKVVISNEKGFAKFTELEVGKYILQEIEVPEDFILDDTKRIVTISKNGDITIEGLSKNENGNFTVLNRQKNDKEIRIYKKWIDNDDSKRTLPSFVLSATKPEKDESAATVKEKAFYNKTNIKTLKPYAGDDYSTLTIKDMKYKPNAQRIDDQKTKYSIYIWSISNSEDYVYWSNAETIYFPQNSSYLFSNTNRLQEADLTKFDTSKVTNMSYMFQSKKSYFNNYVNLNSLNISNWDTSKVTNISYMFNGCEKLTELDISNWDVSNINNTANMFNDCKSLTKLDLSKWNTSNFNDISGMFYNCNKLTSLNVSTWDTSSIINTVYEDRDVNYKYYYYGLFGQCSSLTTLDISNWDTNNITNMSYMFDGCKSLTTLDISKWNLKNITNMSYMFNECQSLKSINLSDQNITQNNDNEDGFNNISINFENMFYNCSSLKSIDFSNWNVIYNISNTDEYFIDNNYDYEHYNEPIINLKNICKNCISLTSVNFTNWNIKTSISSDYNPYIQFNFYGMFDGCSSLKTLDLSNWLNWIGQKGYDKLNIISASYMFNECSSLTTFKMPYLKAGAEEGHNPLNNTNFYTTDFCYMFYDCKSLTELDISNWIFIGKYWGDSWYTGLNFDHMFVNCKKLTTIDMTNWETDTHVQNMDHMFYNCYSLTELDFSSFYYGKNNKYNRMNLESASYVFYNCSSLKSLNLSGWSIYSNDLSYMFYDCNSLTELNLSNWNINNVTDMNNMFSNCKSLTTLDISNWDTSNITDMHEMFLDCISLTELDLSGWDTSNVTDMSAMFYMDPFEYSELISLNISNWNTSNVTNMSEMFEICSSLTELNLSNWNTSNVTNMSYMFFECYALIELNVSNWNTSNVTNMNLMFYECNYLINIYVSEKWNINNVKDSEDMFNECWNLPNYDEDIIDKTKAYYGEGGYLTYRASSNPGMIVLDNNVVDKLLNLFTITAYAAESIQEYHSVTSNAYYIPNVDEKTPVEKFGTYNASTKTYEWTAENNGYWSKVDDDTWVYVFHVYDTNLDWYVYEGDVKGKIGLDAIYSSDHSIENSGLIKASDPKEFTITNSIKNPDPEPEIITKSLTVKKQVVNSEHQNINDSADFTFHVEFDIPDFDDETAIFGETVFTKENNLYKADVSLKSTEEITFTDIPINTVYTVTEEEVNNYISETPEQTGTLTNDESLNFINILDIPDTVKHNIAITKTVTGRSNDESFEIHVSIDNCIDGEYSLSNGETIVVKNQSGYITINLHADETVTINQLPTGAIVSVTETGGKNYKAKGYIDEDGIKTSGNSAITGKDLTLSYTIPEDAVNAGFVINNTIIQTQNLIIKKQAFDADGNDSLDEDAYTFSILLQGLPDGAVIPTSIGNLVADGSGIIERDIYLKNHEELHIYELPIDTQYQITEKANKMIGSYEVIDNNAQDKIIKTFGYNDIIEKDISTELETVDPDEDVVITFTNREQKIEYLPATGGFGYNYCNIFYLLVLGAISNWYYKKKKKIA